MKRIFVRLWPPIVLAILVILFFGKTLTGGEVFMTPDFGRSDLLHSTYPAHFFIAKNLKEGRLPLWNPHLGGGFPFMALPQGVFHPLNFLVFRFVPLPQAFAIATALVFLAVGAGTMAVARSWGVGPWGVLASGITAAFSGAMAVKIVHFPGIQTFSLFPWMLWGLVRYLETRKSSYWFVLVVASGIQILVGFYQMVLYSQIVLGAYTVWKFLSEKSLVHFWKQYVAMLTFGLILAWGIGAVQLFPSIEFTRLSNRRSGIPAGEVFRFPYPVAHLATFLSPYALGDPRRGTYPIFSESWGIFWENTGYMGILPLIFVGIAVGIYWKTTHAVRFLVLLLFVSLLLMLGKHSPFAWLYKIPPFSLFRVPARWIFFLTFAVSLLGGFGLEALRSLSRKMFATPLVNRLTALGSAILTAVIVIDLFAFGMPYNLRASADDITRDSETAGFIQKGSPFIRSITLGNEVAWNSQYLRSGYGNVGFYAGLMETQEPDWNVVSGIDQAWMTGILVTQRLKLWNDIFRQQTSIQSERYNITPLGEKLLDMAGVGYILSPFSVRGEGMSVAFTTSRRPKVTIYRTSDPLPRAYAVGSVVVVPSPGVAGQVIADSQFDPHKIAVIEGDLKDVVFSPEPGRVRIQSYRDTNVEIVVSGQGNRLLVLADSFYPGWVATLDGKPTPIYPANLLYRAIVVPGGDHTVRFSYRPMSIIWGGIVSIGSLALIIGTVWKKKSAAHKALRGGMNFSPQV